MIVLIKREELKRKRSVLQKRIEALRRELYKVVKENQNNLQAPEVVGISEELDGLITRFLNYDFLVNKVLYVKKRD